MAKPTEAAWRREKERQRDDAERKRAAARTPEDERHWRGSRDNVSGW
jgi:hypothetical protein